MTRTIFVAAAAVFFATGVHAKTWHISPAGTGEAPTIQAGIDSSADGDVVLLSPGTYTGEGNRNISFEGKAVTVESSSGAALTTIDCGGSGRGFVFASGESEASILSGVRVVNGSHPFYGGAVHCVKASPVIHDCSFFGNHAGIGGGAVYCDTSSAVLSGNSFENNDAAYGGAVACTGTSSAFIANNDFISNAASISGGAIACRAAAPSIEGNRFAGNEATNEGGAVFCDQASAPFISANSFHGNRAGDNGGAIGLLQSSPTVEHNIFRANQAALGGGVYCNNFSEGPIRYNTFDENSALSGAGSAICCTNFSAAPISNNIIVNSPLGTPIDTKNDSVPTISCVCFFNNAAGDTRPPGSIDGGGIFSLDPEFCGIDGSGNYFLQSDSPCAPGNTAAPGNCGQIGRHPVSCGTTPPREKSWGATKALFRDG
jgi:predicted outer membrane repeat protein